MAAGVVAAAVIAIVAADRGSDRQAGSDIAPRQPAFERGPADAAPIPVGDAGEIPNSARVLPEPMATVAGVDAGGAAAAVGPRSNPPTHDS